MLTFFSKLNANNNLAYDFKFNDINGNLIELNNYKDKVIELLEDINFRIINIIKADEKNVSYGSDYYLANF